MQTINNFSTNISETTCRFLLTRNVTSVCEWRIGTLCHYNRFKVGQSQYPAIIFAVNRTERDPGRIIVFSSLSLILHLTVARASDKSPKYRHGIRTRVTCAMNRHLLLLYRCQNKSDALTKQAYSSFLIKICYTTVKIKKILCYQSLRKIRLINFNSSKK